MSKLKTFLRHPIKAVQNRRNDRYEARMKHLLKPEVYNTLPDKKALEARYYQIMGKKLDLRHPRTYSEKLQWLKLYDRRPEYATMVDKYAVKKYVADKIGEEYVVPLLGVWERAEEIDFDALPEQFVLKTNHDTANVLICKDKSAFDRERALKHLSSCLNTNNFLWGREWPYKNVKRLVFAEALLKDDASDDLPDYKFFCFDGKVRFFLIATDRYKKGEKTKLDFFYPDGRHMDACYGYPNAKTPPPLPSKLDEMMRLAEILSKGIPHVRVDFYECNKKVYFGELTFYTGCGFISFTPEQWEETIGSYLRLPKKKRTEKIPLFRRVLRHFANQWKDKQYTRMVDLLTPGNCEKLSDKRFLKLKYLQLFEKKLDLHHPKTYTEKLQWLKLYDRQPEYIPMVDKFEVKKIVAEKIGEEYVVPTLGVWSRAEDIDFDALPEQFVLKCTHDSGSIVICKDKKNFDQERAKEKLAACLKETPFFYGREWPYLGVNPRIIAEPYLEDAASGELPDYKFFCFDGVVKALFIATDRQKEEETKFDFYDADGNHLNLRNGHPNAVPAPALPSQFEKMKELASVLSSGFPHVRVDFYECNRNIYFGEFTFFHHSGLVPFDPPAWDETFGSWLTLPKHKTKAKSIQKYQ